MNTALQRAEKHIREAGGVQQSKESDLVLSKLRGDPAKARGPKVARKGFLAES